MASKNKIVEMSPIADMVSPSQEDMSLNMASIAQLLDAMARHYGIGLNGEWGRFSGAEAIFHHAFHEGELMSIMHSDFVVLIESGLMVYDTSMGDAPPKRLNSALHDLLKKMKNLLAMTNTQPKTAIIH